MLSEIDHFASLTFEKVYKQFSWQGGLSEKLTFISTNICNLWKRNEEIGLIVLGKRNAILVEFKWTIKLIGIDILTELEQKGQLAKPELEKRQIQFDLCS